MRSPSPNPSRRPPTLATRLRGARLATARRFPRFIRRQLRPLSLTLIALLTMTQIIALTPSSVEEPDDPVSAVDPQSLVPEQERTLAEGVPHDKVPDYSIEVFTHVSTQGGERQWKLFAEKAFLYNQEKLVHARRVKALLYDPDGKITVVTGREAKYFMNRRDLEVYGDVKTTFPDGFQVHSDFLRHQPNERLISIPLPYDVAGNPDQSPEHRISFTSKGLVFDMAKGQITLLSNVHLTTLEGSPAPKASASPGVLLSGSPLAAGSAGSPSSRPVPPAVLASLPAPMPASSPDGHAAPTASPRPKTAPPGTTIESDRAVIYRDRQVANFQMRASRPLKTRFVHITQPTMFARARWADLSYGNFDQLLNYLVLHEDVLVKETHRAADSLRYATGGKAEFDAHKELVVLTEFPQVYQDNDTVTGDVIRLFRDSDVVEVEHSNAFSQGSN